MDRLEWLLWRRGGLGSSDANILMEMSPFKTVIELYEDKISNEPVVDESNFITDMGNELEPRVRSLFSLIHGQSYEPALCVMEEFPFIRASLDGRGVDDPSKIIEIKLLGAKDIELTKAGAPPPKYWPQVQHQLLVSGAETCYFVGYPYSHFKENRRAPLMPDLLVVVAVKADKRYQAELLAKEVHFWQEHVLKKVPPSLGKDDYAELKGQAKLISAWRKLKQDIDNKSEKLAELREKIVAVAEDIGHSRFTAKGFRMRKESRVGTIDYKKIPAVKAMTEQELDSFRGKGSESWKLEIVD